MISLFIALVGFCFLYLSLAVKNDEKGEPISSQSLRLQLVLALVFLVLGAGDFLLAPLNQTLLFFYRLAVGFFLLWAAGRAGRQVAVSILYLTSILIMLRGLLEFMGR